MARSCPTGRCFGSWVAYALGTENRDLPSYVVLSDPGGLPIDGDSQLGKRLAAGRLSRYAVPHKGLARSCIWESPSGVPRLPHNARS